VPDYTAKITFSALTIHSLLAGLDANILKNVTYSLSFFPADNFRP